MRCPLCRDEIVDRRAMPFCSDRCRQQDLSQWLGGDYRIPGEPIDPLAMRDDADAHYLVEDPQ